MSEWSKAMWETLRSRHQIRPDDLAPFGSELKTSFGHTLEVLAWYGPSSDETLPFARERLAFGFVIDGTAPKDMTPGALLLGYCAESQVVSSKIQRFPRFDQWLVRFILTGNSNA